MVGISIAQLTAGKNLISFGTRIEAKSKVSCHAHMAGEEWYIILSGAGIIHLADINNEEATNIRHFNVSAGDVFCIQPKIAHQLVATSQLDLLFLCPAEHLSTDRHIYPDLG